MLAKVGIRNLAGSRAAGGTGALAYVITHSAPLRASGAAGRVTAHRIFLHLVKIFAAARALL